MWQGKHRKQKSGLSRQIQKRIQSGGLLPDIKIVYVCIKQFKPNDIDQTGLYGRHIKLR
jgi:hypothetical protein